MFDGIIRLDGIGLASARCAIGNSVTDPAIGIVYCAGRPGLAPERLADHGGSFREISGWVETDLGPIHDSAICCHESRERCKDDSGI